MKKALFKKIKKSKYSKYASFAVWVEDNVEDLSVIERGIKDLNQNIVIVGLNASGSTGKFQNFHSIHRGGRDSWLKDAFNHSCLRGAYMTDIIKNDTSSRQSSVDLSEENIVKNIEEFKRELDLIKCEKPYIIAIGDKTSRILQQYLHEHVNRIYFIPHYAKFGIRKKDFIDSVRKLV